MTRRYELGKGNRQELHRYQQSSNTHPTIYHLCARRVGLSHGIQCAAVLEPLDLRSIVGVGELDLERLTILWVNLHGQWLSNFKLGAQQVDLEMRVSVVTRLRLCLAYLILWVNLIIIRWVLEGKRKHALLLQVRLVNTGEGPGDDGETTQVPWLESSVLARASLSVVPVSNNDPRNVLLLVVSGSGWNGIPLTGGEVLDLVCLSVGLVDGANEHVVGDVVQMSTVLEPWASHGDVISGGLALALDQDWEVGSILAVPWLEWLKNLKTIAGWRDGNSDLVASRRWGLVGVLSWIEVSACWKSISAWWREEELVAILVLELVGKRVEVQVSGNGHCNDEIWRSDEGVGGWVGVIAASEVTVVRREDRVSLALLDVLTVPLTNAWTASICQNHTTELLEGSKLAITLDGGSNLLGTRGNGEEGLGLDAVVEGITSDGGGAGHILIGGVGARTNQTNLKLLGPAVGFDSLAELGDRSSKIWGKWAVDVWLELRQVDLDQLIVLGALILSQLLGVDTSKVTDILTLRDGKVVVHAVVEWEEGGRSTNFSAHVADGGHTSARDTVDTWAVVLDNGTSSTLDGQDSGNLKNDI